MAYASFLNYYNSVDITTTASDLGATSGVAVRQGNVVTISGSWLDNSGSMSESFIMMTLPEDMRPNNIVNCMAVASDLADTTVSAALPVMVLSNGQVSILGYHKLGDVAPTGIYLNCTFALQYRTS